MRSAVLRTFLTILVASAFGTTTTASPRVGAASAGPSWTVYHGNASGSGVAPAVGLLDLASRAWTSPALDGQLYGEPLVSGGSVFVATENDTVYGLSAATGAVEWSTHVGTPVPSSSLPCGNISPSVGITGTPVMDETRSELFVVADELVKGRPSHELVGLDSATGRVELTQGVDPAGSPPAALLQRTGLTLDAGHVVFGYGGNYGDCGAYHGWVVSVPENGGPPNEFEADAATGESQGAVWMGGAAPVVDASGNVWVETGNGSVTSPGHAYDDSDAVIELSPSMTLVQYFAAPTWAADNATDLDLSTAPALLGDGMVVAAGKRGTAYLLDGSRLGGIGGEQASLADACGQGIDGGMAVSGSVVYLPCPSGSVAVQVTTSPPGLRLLWRAGVGGGPPIVAAGLVWTIGQDGTLAGLDPTTGTVAERATIGTPANHFPTPSVGDGLLLAPSADQVVAFGAASDAATTSTSSPPATSTTHARPTTTATPAHSSTGGAWPVAAVLVAAALALGAGATWALRRRARRSNGGR
jgi:outer membrane protein assembly factor BamB